MKDRKKISCKILKPFKVQPGQNRDFFYPPANVQPGQNRDFTDPVEGLPFDAQKPFEG